MALSRITHDPAVLGGKPCIRGLRISLSTIVGLVASGVSRERILAAYPLLKITDLDTLQTQAIHDCEGYT